SDEELEEPIKDQPLPTDASPTALSPGYIADSDPEEDEEDPEEDPADHPADGGDNDDNESADDDDDNDDEDPADYPTDRDEEEEEEPSKDEADDKDEDEDDDEEEEEHPASVDSVPPPVYDVTARMSIREQPPTPFWSEAKVFRLLAIPSPPPSPLSPYPTYPLGYRVAMIRLRAETPFTSHPLPLSTPPSGTPPLLHIPLPTPSPPLLLPSTDYRAGVHEVTLPPWKRPSGGFRADYGFVATLDDEIRRDPERDVGYGITDTWDEMLVGMPGEPTTNDTELGQRMTNFVATVRQDTDEIYGRLDEAQDARAAWVRSMDASDIARSEVRALWTTVLAQQAEIGALRAANRTRQAQLMETLTLLRTLQTQKMAPKRTTRANPAATTATTSVTNAQLKAKIEQGVTDALAARDADINTNGDDSHNSETGVRRTERVARECTYPDFMKCSNMVELP
ncbi:hypothetical protein Tco_1065179, partial [Tanacetum coccineum]